MYDEGVVVEPVSDEDVFNDYIEPEVDNYQAPIYGDYEPMTIDDVGGDYYVE